MTSKDSDKPVQPPRMAMILLYPSKDSLEAVESTCDQRRFCSDCADAQANLSLRWSHKSYCRFCRALAHLYIQNNGGPKKTQSSLCIRAVYSECPLSTLRNFASLARSPLSILRNFASSASRGCKVS